MSDPAKYRKREEVDTIRKTRDPIDHVRTILLDAGVTEESLRTIEADVKAVVNDSAEFAQTSPEPDPAELYTDVLLEA